MKAITVIQKIMALMMLCVGFIMTFSEVPITQGWENQAWLSCGGLALIGVCLLWLKLVGWEESCFETGTKANKNRKNHFA